MVKEIVLNIIVDVLFIIIYIFTLTKYCKHNRYICTIYTFHIFQEGYVSRQITHAHFTAWPDKDVPDTPWHLVNFWRKIESMYSNDECSIVIHCRYYFKG